METGDRNITLTLLFKGERHIVTVCSNQYHNLMVLISMHLAVDGFGLCCGMGSCGTCMVEMGDKYSQATRCVLACDVQINDGLANTQIIIPERRY